MSPIGHSLVGLALSTVAMPRGCSFKSKFCISFAYVALANLPDWPIPMWGHDRYDISHSVFVNAALIALLVSCWLVIPRINARAQNRIVLFGAAAWLSHLLLDSFYNHGRGIGIYWPFSDGRLVLSMPWFSTLDLDQAIYAQHNLSVFAIELVAYFPILVLTVVVRRRTILPNRARDDKVINQSRK